jgi:hypothetical protein
VHVPHEDVHPRGVAEQPTIKTRFAQPLPGGVSPPLSAIDA